MLTRFEHQDITWIDLENPSVEELDEISKEFSIGAVLTEELLTPTAKPRVDVYAESTYAVFHFPTLREVDEGQAQEVDIILGKKHLITVHYTPMDAIDDFKKAFEVETLVGKKNRKLHVGHLLFELAERLYHESENELAVLEDTIENVEKRIFLGEEREMVSAISKVTRQLLEHKRVLGNHVQTLEVLEQVGTSLLGKGMRNYFHGMASLHYRVYNRAVTMADMVDELRETNMALLTTRQNEIMKNLTIIAFVTFPLTLVAGIFGMNTVSTPLIGHPQDFYIILIGMIVMMITFFVYFKARKWF